MNRLYEYKTFIVIKCINKENFNLFTGFPLLMYGLSAIFLISYKEIVKTTKGEVYIYFLLKEDKGSTH